MQMLSMSYMLTMISQAPINKSVVYKAGTLVTQMVTDADGYAKVTDLYPGYYRLH